MAVAPSPNSKATASPTVKDKKRKMLSINDEEEEIKSEKKADSSASQAKKRNSNPGVRVIGGRVYDSENGTTCHQCRQKTYAVYATCKNKAKTKPCPLKYCNTCLLNRYGEKVEEVTLLDEWSCPKCRDACNCSICRKKRGYEPTGQLSQMAKAGGFSSVSNMLDVKGAQSVSNYKRVKETCASPRKQVVSEEGIVITSPKKKGKENLFDGKADLNADISLAISPSVEKPKKSNQKKLKTEGSKEIALENGNSDAMKPKMSNRKKEKAEESKEIVSENGNNDVVKPKKVNQKKVKAEESKGKVLEDGNNDAIKPKKSKQKKLNPEESKEIVLENGNNDAVKPKKSNKKKLQPEESKEVVLENGNNDAVKPKKVNQKKLKPEETKEIVLENGNSNAIKPKKPNQKKEKAEESKEIVLENGNNDVSKPKKVNQKRSKPEGSIEILLAIENNGGNKPKKLTQKKLKLEGSKETIVENGNNDPIKPKKVNQKKVNPEGSKEPIVENGNIEAIKPKKITQKKLKLEKSNEVNGENGNSGAILKVDGVQKKQKGIKKSIQDQTKVDENGKALDGSGDQNGEESMKDKESSKVDKNALHFVDPIITLPTGSELVTIAGIDIPKEDAGNALQLLEFCSTFGKILDVKKGQAEAVLRDLFKGRTTRRGKYSVLIQFHIQLLSIIQSESESESESESPKSEPTNGKDSWLKDLKKCIPKSFISEKIDSIDGKVGGYDNLDSSTKLRLLTFLCDEVLGTEKVRNWMDEQNAKFAEKNKEAKGKLSDAREKEKSLKQKMQDDIAKAIIKREGVPLTLIEHDAIVSKIKKEAAEAHAEMLACKKLVPIDNERPDAVRTEPIYKDNNGHFYWRLKGCSNKSGILLQDIGSGDLSVETLDKWFGYDDEQMDLVEKRLNMLRFRVRKGYKNHGMNLM